MPFHLGLHLLLEMSERLLHHKATTFRKLQENAGVWLKPNIGHGQAHIVSETHQVARELNPGPALSLELSALFIAAGFSLFLGTFRYTFEDS